MTTNDLRLDTVQIVWKPDEDMYGCFGCYAVASVSYSIGQGSRRTETLSSGGLWGIDEPSRDYAREIELEQLDDLRAHLKVFGVPVRDFAARFAPALQD